MSAGHTGAAWLCPPLGSALQRQGAPSPWEEERSSLREGSKVSDKMWRMQHNCTCFLLIKISSSCCQISVHRSTAKGKLRHAMISCLALLPIHMPEQPQPAHVPAIPQLGHSRANSLSKLLLTSRGAGWTLQPPTAPLQGAFGGCSPVGQRGGSPAAAQD